VEEPASIAVVVAEKVERAKFVIAARLRDARKAKGISQVKLSTKSIVSLRCIQKIEAGDVCPDVYTLFKLGEVVDMTPQEFLK
jgi:ribosome-binding protein aMBF1 (putative translation factor)